MTTRTWTAVTDHTSDAGFRAWGSMLAAELQAAGLVQTADTGQINWTTVNRPGTNTDAGYEVYYLNDSLHATAPVYLRLAYGTGSSGVYPRVQVTVGTGSNGSGTITGTALSAAFPIISNAPSSAVAYQSYLCVTDGFVGIVLNPTSNGRAFFALCRTVDAAGAYTAEGASVYWGNSSSGSMTNYKMLRFAAPAAAYPDKNYNTGGYCVVPNSPTSSLVGADFQVYQHWIATPRVRPIIGLCTVVLTEINLGSTFSATLVGATAHTYFSVGAGQAAEVTGSGTYCIAMLWE